MTIKTITYFSTLCKLAREEYLAGISGDPKALEEAKKAHECYKSLCLAENNKMIYSKGDFRK